MNKAYFVSLVLFWIGCNKDPCFNISELDNLSAQTQEWYIHDSIGNRTITDQNGINQTLVVIDRNSGRHENTATDECGNSYGSFYYSVQYQASISPVNLLMDIRGSALPEDGFYLKLTVIRTNPFQQKSTTYDFVTGTSRENNSSGALLDQVQISGKDYYNVLRITFNNTVSENEVKTVFYAKGLGIIKYINANGIEFDVQ